ncbi:hypothetical protein Bca101_088322 [Brassica carinata]
MMPLVSREYETKRKGRHLFCDRETRRGSTVSSVVVEKPNGKTVVSPSNPVNPNAAAVLSDAHGSNPITRTLIGQEMLLIDEELEFCLIILITLRFKFRKIGSGFMATMTLGLNVTQRVICMTDEHLIDTLDILLGYEFGTISSHGVLDEVDIAERRHLSVHVQIHDGPVMKLYLWDNAAFEFCHKFKSYDGAPSVLLVTTLNPKHVGGTFCLASMSSSRVFMDTDVQPTRDYLEWLSSNTDVANRIAADVVTKPEAVTLEELFSYIKQEGSKVAWFECTATIDDVIRDSAWYYISCGDCNTKAVKGPSSLVCPNKKCVNNEVMGVAQYLTRISVYDKSEQAVFVILGDAGKQLTGKDASELVANYFEANEGAGADHLAPVPQALLDAIGQTHKFIVKVSDHNLQGKTRTLTVTKILPSEALLPGKPDGIPKTGGEDFGPSRGFVNSAGDKARKASESPESAGAKRPKSG